MTEQEFREIYPPEIIELMLQRQEEQGNPRNIKPFLNEIRAALHDKGFTWDRTIEKDIFWDEVLVHRNFELFYDRYLKKNKTLELCQKIEELISHLEK
jgi:hypothetical protein